MIPWLALLLSAGSLAGQTGPPVPRPAPELALNMLSGKHLLLSGLRGRVVTLEFLYTTCPHCQQTSQVLNKLQQEYGPRGFQAVGAAFNDGAALLLPDFLKQLRITYPVGLTSLDTALRYLGLPPRSFQLPQLVFIDRKGTIRAQIPGGDGFFLNEEKNIRAMLELLLKEPRKR